MPSPPVPEKSAPYFTVLEALRKPGCAVCHIMSAAATSHIDTLFHEQVTDVGVRRKLRQARGLCPAHTQKASTMIPAALGIAIVARDLLEEEGARLDALQPRALWQRMGDFARSRLPRQTLLAYVRGWRRRGMCPACQIAAEHERHALETILNFLQEEEFVRRFEGAGGMCVPHVMHAAETHSTHPGLIPLLAVQRRLYAQLLAELDEFCRKHDYRFTQEPWGAEADAWQRALQLLAGQSPLVGGAKPRLSARPPSLFFQVLHSWWR